MFFAIPPWLCVPSPLGLQGYFAPPPSRLKQQVSNCPKGIFWEGAVITGYDSNSKTSMIESCVIAENDNFTLSFDKDNLNISFLCKNNETVWNTVPENDKIKTEEKSTLNIRVQDTQVRTESTHYSSSATRVSSKKDKNSVTITYYFDEVQISVPVTYTLRDDSLLLSIDGKDVRQ